jgi:ribosomal protein S18 acetylase RimI-like enzyme
LEAATAKMEIRRTNQGDYPRWLHLWTGYCLFYSRELHPEVTAHTWSRLMNPASSIFGFVAEDAGQVVGIANCVMHENTSTLQPVCYLQDLYVDPEARAGGIGKQMIDWLLAEMRAQGWARVYWATKENNYRARGMYDKFTSHSGFLRYVVYNPDFQK